MTFEQYQAIIRRLDNIIDLLNLLVKDEKIHR